MNKILRQQGQNNLWKALFSCFLRKTSSIKGTGQYNSIILSYLPDYDECFDWIIRKSNTAPTEALPQRQFQELIWSNRFYACIDSLVRLANVSLRYRLNIAVARVRAFTNQIIFLLEGALGLQTFVSNAERRCEYWFKSVIITFFGTCEWKDI